jgi:hypothetical protein
VSGTLTIPNTFGAASGTIPASELDVNNTTIRDYINNREITLGLLSARPAAGIAGRYYFATDAGLGYVDTGSAWVQINNTGVGVSVGIPAVSGLAGTNNSGAPTTKMDYAADAVLLVNPSDGTAVRRTSTGTLTNDTAVATAANGRDQAGAFSASSFVHFYFIWDGVTLATLSSATPPPTGPTLPGAYTHWAYAGACWMDNTSALTRIRMRGGWMLNDGARFVVRSQTASTETGVDLTTTVSANATIAQVTMSCVTIGGSGVASQAILRVVAGTTYAVVGNSGTANMITYNTVIMPNINQSAIYLITGGGTPPQFSLLVDGFRVSNGDV